MVRVIHRGIFCLTIKIRPLDGGTLRSIRFDNGIFLWAFCFQVAVLAAVAAKRKSGGSDSHPSRKRKVIVYPQGSSCVLETLSVSNEVLVSNVI